VLLHALGSADDFAPSVTGMPMRILPGDAFLMCSDGLWEYVDEAAMLQTRARAGSAREWLELMEAELLRHASGSYDNYSAIAVWFAASEDRTLPLGC
jgi:serine/threonine protein phosphatase PrpC